MMKWKNKRILFYIYSSSNIGVDRHTLQQLSMVGAKTMDESYETIQYLLKNDYLRKESSLFFLTDRSHDIILPLYLESEKVLSQIKFLIQERFGEKIDVHGGSKGMYFTYSNSSKIFRFHIEEYNGELVVRVRLPSLIIKSKDHEFNDFYIKKEVAINSDFLLEIIEAHLKMLKKADY